MKKAIFLLLMSAPLWAGAPARGLAEEAPNAIVDSIVLEDFSEPDARGLPKGWIAQRENPDPAEVYQIRKEGDRMILSATGRPNRIFKKVQWNPNEYPFLTWKWRMKKVPVDPQKERRAAVYVSLDRDPFGIPKITKYLWSSLAEVGEEKSGGFFSASAIVLRSGADQEGEWVTETINVREDFKRLHGENPPDAAYGIGVMTNIKAEFGPFIAHR